MGVLLAQALRRQGLQHSKLALWLRSVSHHNDIPHPLQ
jgi:hypothetical protein